MVASTLVGTVAPVANPEMAVMGYTGCGTYGAEFAGARFSGKPTLQVGGEQEALMAADPG